jgi:hypothetical protein
MLSCLVGCMALSLQVESEVNRVALCKGEHCYVITVYKGKDQQLGKLNFNCWLSLWVSWCVFGTTLWTGTGQP